MSQPQTLTPNSQPPNEDLRVGVFHCGLNIADTVDIKQIVEYAKIIRKQNWCYFQATLLYNARTKAVTTQKRWESVERKMVIEVL